jgi:hypothetical protein
LLKSGKARPKRNKLGLFYVQLCCEQEPDNQPLVAGIDPGSKFEGFSVVGTVETVLNLMLEAPDHVKEAVKTRRTMREPGAFASGVDRSGSTTGRSARSVLRLRHAAGGRPKPE